MKKKLAILLSLAMIVCFMLGACGGDDADLSDSKYVGSWKAESLSLAGESEDLDGGIYVLTLDGDGTGSFDSTDPDGETEESSSITWSLTDDGFKTKGDVKLTFTDDGDGIKAKIFGVEMHFVRYDGESEETSDESTADGKAYGYGGDDPVEAEVYRYVSEALSNNFDPADVSIPTVSIVYVDYTPEDEIVVYGDFWVDNYMIEGDTLKCVSGGNFPGVIHMTKDYVVTSLDPVADGGDFDSSARELFGEHYDDFMKVYSDDDARDELRKATVSDYVSFNGLDVTQYQDEGWDPVELYK